MELLFVDAVQYSQHLVGIQQLIIIQYEIGETQPDLLIGEVMYGTELKKNTDMFRLS